jgi:hypothetical protein
MLTIKGAVRPSYMPSHGPHTRTASISYFKGDHGKLHATIKHHLGGFRICLSENKDIHIAQHVKDLLVSMSHMYNTRAHQGLPLDDDATLQGAHVSVE